MGDLTVSVGLGSLFLLMAEAHKRGATAGKLGELPLGFRKTASHLSWDNPGVTSKTPRLPKQNTNSKSRDGFTLEADESS